MKFTYLGSSKRGSRDSYWDRFYFRWLEKSVIEIGKAASIALISNHLNWKPSEVCRITRTEKPIGPGTNWLGEWQERIILKFVNHTREKNQTKSVRGSLDLTLQHSIKKNPSKNAKRTKFRCKYHEKYPNYGEKFKFWPWKISKIKFNVSEMFFSVNLRNSLYFIGRKNEILAHVGEKKWRV